MVGAEICINNSFIRFNLRWGSLGNDATLGHDHDPVGDFLHHIHIVLNKYHGAAFTWQGFDELEQALGQGWVDTRHRFIKHHQRGVGHERPRHLQQFALAARHGSRILITHVSEIESLQDRIRSLLNLLFLLRP